LYTADSSNHLIRKITPAGVVTTFAGSGSPGSTNGTGTGASFNTPQGIAVDSAGTLYVADTNNQRIRKITPAGVVTTFAVISSRPQGITIDPAGNLYVSGNDNKIIKITTT